MITYIFQKYSALRAFEGPEKPDPNDFVDQDDLDTKFQHDAYRYACDVWESEMSTARESALPVVNAEEVGFLIEGSTILLNEEGLSRLKLFARPGETVALPGWGLKINEPTNEDTRIAYRLVRSEPVKKELIKLTFYSQKLWNSDKPFPAKPQTGYKVTEFTYAETTAGHNQAIQDWLSTAYEVQNPEVLTLIVQLKDMSDGDELTLPERYGIQVSHEIIRSGSNHWKAVDISRWHHADIYNENKRIVATITLPEKPENSAHLPVEQSIDIFDQRVTSAANVIRFLGEYIHGINCGKRPDLTLFDLKNASDHFSKLVEPSESQEEMLDKIVIAYRNWLDDPETGMKAYRIFQKEQLEKFTITRK